MDGQAPPQKPQHGLRATAPADDPPGNAFSHPVPASSLALTLRALQPLLGHADVTEICINRPGEAFIETQTGWRQEHLPFADFNWCYRLAKLVANATRQRIAEESPLLSAALPGGERVQIVIPPATAPGCVAITVRRPATTVWSIRELAERGVFRTTRRAAQSIDPTEQELLGLLAAQDYEAFMGLAVRAKKNIVVSGATGSGKTTFTKALIREIPANERLITIEDAPELVLQDHPNHVRLFYSKGDQGQAKVTPKHLLESCLRMRPDRILLAELRSDEAFDYLRNVNSGHPGSITSVHASSADLAFEQLTLLVKQSRSGGDLPRPEIKTLLYLLVDIVVQFGVVGHQRCIQEIWYDPARKRALATRV
jgi:type IV secretion system protein VirB11